MLDAFIGNLIGGLLGFLFGILGGAIFMVIVIEEGVTHNHVLYDQNITVNTVPFKKWVIEHEADLKIKDLNE
jgi:hypothetical protein